MQVSGISVEDRATAHRHREQGFVPAKFASITLRRMVVKEEIEGSRTRASFMHPIQEPISPAPMIAYSRSSTVTERIMTCAVARTLARMLGLPMFIPQFNREIPISIEEKTRLLDPSVPMTHVLESAAFDYLNGQPAERCIPARWSWSDIERNINVLAIADMIIAALSVGFTCAHIPRYNLFARMIADKDDRITTANLPDEGAMPSGSRTIAVPVVFVRAMRMPTDVYIERIQTGSYEPPLFLIIGDVLFVPFDSTAYNKSFAHRCALEHASNNGVKYVRAIVTLDTITLERDVVYYFESSTQL